MASVLALSFSRRGCNGCCTTMVCFARYLITGDLLTLRWLIDSLARSPGYADGRNIDDIEVLHGIDLTLHSAENES